MARKVNRGGRPPRAEGERMERLSVVVRQRYRTAVDLVSRQRRTSASQALEYLLTVAAKEYEIEGVPLLALADQLVEYERGVVGALQRLCVMPQSLLTPFETFTVEVARLLPDIAALTTDEAAFLMDVARDAEVSGNTPEFALQLWRKVCEALLQGDETFEWEDEAGLRFKYELKISENGPRILPPEVSKKS